MREGKSGESGRQVVWQIQTVQADFETKFRFNFFSSPFVHSYSDHARCKFRWHEAKHLFNKHLKTP